VPEAPANRAGKNSKRKKEGVMRKLVCNLRWQYKALLAVVVVAVLATSALAFTDIFTYHGSLKLTNYTGFNAPIQCFTGDLTGLQNYTGPATVEVQAVSLIPNEVVPWHYHVGLTYAILVRGTVASTTVCGKPEVFHAGAGFVEPPGLVHTVKNIGHGDAVFYWATLYPDMKGVTDLNVLPEAPTCN
jgi:quercetin dioxygenase-like cupin family protein